MAVKLHLREHIDARAWTPADLVRALNGRISQTVTYRLVDDHWTCLKREQLDALADALGVAPDALLRKPPKRR
jgi:hypothetical protein